MSFAVAGFAILVVLRLTRGFVAFKDRRGNIDRPKDDGGAFKFACLDKPGTRAARIAKFVAMLAAGEAIYPPRKG